MLLVGAVGSPSASVIVRARDEERLIGRTLSLLRSQTVEPEIIVVDSGSRDTTIEIALRFCDRLIELPADRFTYGRALNVGADAATAPVHFALSAHCPVEREDWIERSLAYYERRRDVAATCGARADPSGRPLGQAFLQDAEHARAHPYWGFSNHASSWRADIWARFPFDESLGAAEDREWAFRVLADGWLIAFDPALYVGLSHRWKSGLVAYYRRMKKESEAVSSFTNLPPYRVRDLLREWWSEMPDTRHAPLLYRLDYRRLVGLVGKYRGERAGDAS